MRVKISANPPLPLVRAWLPLHAQASTPTISAFKSLLCTSLPAFCSITPSSLCLSIDGFELLDNSELSVVRDGDLISVDVREDAHATQKTRLEAAPSRKRKRRMSTPSSSSSEASSDSDSESESESSDSESTSDSEEESVSSEEKAEPPRVQPATLVPPGYGKPQTRARNLRRRLRQMHEREGGVSGPVSGANAVEPGEEASQDAQDVPALLSLSLRNKNKAKNFKSLMGKPLPPKIIFGDEGNPMPRLIPPSSRSSVPANVIVTSVDVEAGLHREKKKRKMADEYEEELSAEVTLDYGDAEPEEDIERTANKQWATLAKLTRNGVAEGMVVGYKALGIDPVTYTPGQVLTVGRVVSWNEEGLHLRPLRGVSFHGPVEAEEEVHAWEEIEGGDWRMIASSLGTPSRFHPTSIF
ncbi:hypothetical protein OG21DRAFT_1484241 [Imleria badia]|nr:hypothetical protein OG21DRAFT_1484241 [Imleria badia]